MPNTDFLNEHFVIIPVGFPDIDERAELIAAAEAAHADLPHYRGHWDGWEVVTIRRNLRSRGAPIASKGERVLMDPEGPTTEDHPDVIAGHRSPGFVTVFLPNHWIKRGIDTSVAVKDVILERMEKRTP